MLLPTGHELSGAECISGTEMEMKSLPANEQAITDVLKSLSQLNMMKPGKTLQVRMSGYWRWYPLYSCLT